MKQKWSYCRWCHWTTGIKRPRRSKNEFIPLYMRHPERGFCIETESNSGTSLVAQWIRIHLPMQGSQVRSNPPSYPLLPSHKFSSLCVEYSVNLSAIDIINPSIWQTCTESLLCVGAMLGALDTAGGRQSPDIMRVMVQWGGKNDKSKKETLNIRSEGGTCSANIVQNRECVLHTQWCVCKLSKQREDNKLHGDWGSRVSRDHSQAEAQRETSFRDVLTENKNGDQLQLKGFPISCPLLL